MSYVKLDLKLQKKEGLLVEQSQTSYVLTSIDKPNWAEEDTDYINQLL
jgi:hypothetical protein